MLAAWRFRTTVTGCRESEKSQKDTVVDTKRYQPNSRKSATND